MPQLVHAPPPVRRQRLSAACCRWSPSNSPMRSSTNCTRCRRLPSTSPGCSSSTRRHPFRKRPARCHSWHWPAASQHPVGHEVGLHTHVPPEQTWPGEHAGPVPHWQVPADPHPSAVMPQLTQEEPLVPQNAALGDMQLVPEQQPEHDAAVQMHAPPEQT